MTISRNSIYFSILGGILCTIFIAGFAGCEKKETTPGSPATETFMWVGADNLLPGESRMLENILSFAARHEIIPYESGVGDTTELKKFLRRTQKHNIEKTWIEIGPNETNTGQATAREFVANGSQRRPTLKRFKRLMRVYKRYYPQFARITLFDEAPLGAFARTEGGYLSDFKDFKKYGPRAFAYMHQAIKSVMPQAEVGIFLHHPHNAPPRAAGRFSYIKSFMRKTDSLGAVPDFIYSDVYRGYFNRGYGVEETNDYIRSVVSYTGKIADRYGAEHYQLGQVHTIKLGYTPSKRQIDTNIEAMLEGQPDGIGWYWPNYASTNYRKSPDTGKPRFEGYDVSFDPFVPNAWGKTGPAGSLYGTSRDRFTYAYLSILESTGTLKPDRHFDLWIYGHDFDHTEHKLYLRNAGASSWTFIGYFNPQQDADAYVGSARKKYIYSYNERWHAVAFHALDRKRFLQQAGDGNELEFKITTPAGGDRSAVTALYAMPYRATRHYATESRITSFIEEHARWVSVNSLASHVRAHRKLLDTTTVFTGSARE